MNIPTVVNNNNYNSSNSKANMFLHRKDAKSYAKRNNIAANNINNCYKKQYDAVSFLGNIPLNINRLWVDFANKVTKEYPNKKIEQVITESFLDSKNIIGEGFDKIVFNIPKVGEYVAAFLKNAKNINNQKNFKSIRDLLPKYYFGQAIGGNNQYIVMKKINGKSHSIHNWQPKFWDVSLNNGKVSKLDAENFLCDLKSIEQFPQDSFVDLARQLKYLTNNHIRIDSINPNNVMIDTSRQKMQFIDLLEQFPIFATIKPQINCTRDIENILCDALLNPQYLSVLGHNDANELRRVTQNISCKSRIAGEMANLSNDSKIAEQLYVLMRQHNINNGHISPNFLEYYKTFIETYKDIIKF